MLPKERLEEIKKISIDEKKVYVSKLSERFKVTEETIRRDLEKLEKQGLVTRSYGGAMLNIKNLKQNKFLEINNNENIQNKKCVAKKVISFINGDSAIAVDSSSTVLEVLRLIEDRNDVTIITNSITVLQELSKSELNIISTGGSVNRKSLSLEGSITKDTIKKYNADIALVSCKGLDINKGILDLDEIEAESKRIMIKQANKVILLADNTKFDKTSLIKLFDYEDIDCIITDKKPEEKWLELLDSHNIEIIY